MLFVLSLTTVICDITEPNWFTAVSAAVAKNNNIDATSKRTWKCNLSKMSNTHGESFLLKHSSPLHLHLLAGHRCDKLTNNYTTAFIPIWLQFCTFFLKMLSIVLSNELSILLCRYLKLSTVSSYQDTWLWPDIPSSSQTLFSKLCGLFSPHEPIAFQLHPRGWEGRKV